jgi:hypothetical protein
MCSLFMNVSNKLNMGLRLSNSIFIAATFRLQFAEHGIITSLVSMIATPSTSPDIREHALRVLYNISLEG